jgi:hypothetical protein
MSNASKMAQKARVVALSSVLALGMLGYYSHIFLPKARATRAAHQIGFFYAEDLYPYWFGSRQLLAHGLSPYTDETTRQIQSALYGRPLDPQNPYERDQHRFSYPLHIVLLMAPVAWLPFATLRAAGAVLLPLLVVVGILLWSKAMRVRLSRLQMAVACILTLSTYSLLDGLLTQQVSLFVFFVLALAMWCVAEERFVFSGIALALSTVKPQLVILPIGFLLVWSLSRWPECKKLARSFVVTIAILLGISTILLPSWPMEWWHTIISYRRYTVPPLAPYILGNFTGTVLSVLLLGLAIWLSWKVRKEETTSDRFALAFAFTLIVPVVTLSTGNAVYDHVFPLPGVLLLVSQWRAMWRRGAPVRLLLSISAAIFAWQWLSGSVVFLLQLAVPGVIRSPLILSAPLRTQPAMPFAVLALVGLRIMDSFIGAQTSTGPREPVQTSSSSLVN